MKYEVEQGKIGIYIKARVNGAPLRKVAHVWPSTPGGQTHYAAMLPKGLKPGESEIIGPFADELACINAAMERVKTWTE